MISRALNVLGLVTRVEHEAAKRQAVADKQLIEHLRADVAAYDAKFKLAATDLAKQAEEIAGYKHRAGLADDLLNAQSAEILALRPDALLWRNARDKRSRDRKKGAES